MERSGAMRVKCFLARKFSIVREAHPVGADFVKSARTEKGPGMVGDTQVSLAFPSASFLDLAKVLGTLFETKYPAGRSHALAQARLGQRCIHSSSHPPIPGPRFGSTNSPSQKVKAAVTVLILSNCKQERSP